LTRQRELRYEHLDVFVRLRRDFCITHRSILQKNVLWRQDGEHTPKRFPQIAAMVRLFSDCGGSQLRLTSRAA
jgi:hypothetical protein